MYERISMTCAVIMILLMLMLFRSDDILTLLTLAETFQFEVIPLVQTFGHFEVLALILNDRLEL